MTMTNLPFEEGCLAKYNKYELLVPLENVLAADDYLQNNNKKSNSNNKEIKKICFAKYLKAGDREYARARILYMNDSDRNGIVYDSYLKSSIK